MKHDQACVCGSGSGEPYRECCGPLHQGQAADSAVALMRSRYSAYVLKLGDYLLATWYATERPPTLDLADGEDGITRWLGLVIRQH